MNEDGPDGNVPDVTVDGTTINFDVCSLDSCENDHPVVTVEIVLHTSITGIRGSFIQVTNFDFHLLQMMTSKWFLQCTTPL